MNLNRSTSPACVQRSSVAVSRHCTDYQFSNNFRLLWLHFVTTGRVKLTDMKLNEEQKGKICDLIEKSLNSTRLKNHKTDDDSLPLVDLLSIGETILEGQEEIENIVEQIYFDMDDWNI